jgi:hypothetical protein
MIVVTITPVAYEALKAMLPMTDGAAKPGPDGLIRVSLDRATFDQLGRLSESGEGYSDVILRLAEALGRLIASRAHRRRGADDQPGVVPNLEAVRALALCRQRKETTHGT